MSALEKQDILIVDDDESIRNLLSQALRRAGLRCGVATDGLDGAHRIREADYAVVLLDLMMPRVDGLGFLEYLREWQQSSGARAVVLLMTATADPEQLKKAADVVQAILPKPFDLPEVVALCRECVAIRRNYKGGGSPIWRVVPDAEPALVRIEGCWFTMGSDDAADDERPRHRVWVDAFEIGASQVTNSEYAAHLESAGKTPPAQFHDRNFNDPHQPVIGVSWFDAVQYCDWLSSMTGRRFRLPTEAEWECAARGGAQGTRYPWGNAAPHTRRDYARRWRNGPEPVGTSAPNGFGLFDMCENVHEWCSDWYGNDYYSASPERNPRGPENGSRRVSRGGSWRHQIKLSRCAARSSIPPDYRYADYGFRVASTPALNSSIQLGA